MELGIQRALQLLRLEQLYDLPTHQEMPCVNLDLMLCRIQDLRQRGLVVVATEVDQPMDLVVVVVVAAAAAAARNALEIAKIERFYELVTIEIQITYLLPLLLSTVIHFQMVVIQLMLLLELLLTHRNHQH